MNIFSALKSKLNRKNIPADQPYVKMAQQNTVPPSQNPDDYVELEADLHNIAGTNISFGEQKSVQVTAGDSSRDIKQQNSYVIGSNILVSSPEQIKGICEHCEQDAMNLFQAGSITIEQAQLQSLYDVTSAANCQVCGTNTCSRHCRPINVEDQVVHACPQCQKKLEPKFRILKAMAFFLISPILEDEKEGQK